LYETTRSDVDVVAAVDMAATEDITAGKGINAVTTRALMWMVNGAGIFTTESHYFAGAYDALFFTHTRWCDGRISYIT
jgi:hypothetical protein